MAKRTQTQETKGAPAQGAPRVYSYARWSSDAQTDGDSERRQVEAFQAFVTEESARRAREGQPKLEVELAREGKAVSSWKGRNVTEGALGQFLDRVKAREIPAGSWLVVEDVSRLGRAGFDFMYEHVLTPLWKNGITVQFLKPRLEAPPGTSRSMEKFLPIYVELEMTQRFSEDLSRRMKAARSNARKQAVDRYRLTDTQLPAWLELTPEAVAARATNRDSKRVPDLDSRKALQPRAGARDVLARIFRLKLDGAGPDAIAVKLNEDRVPSWPRPERKQTLAPGWISSYVRRLLTDRRLLGEKQPRLRVDVQVEGRKRPKQTHVDEGPPIPDYFPRAVDPKLFHAVQAVFDRGKSADGKSHAGGRTGKALNLFTHLVKCGYCGKPMHPGGSNTLVCSTARMGKGCIKQAANYEELQTLVLENCKALRAEDVLPDPEEKATEVRKLREEVQALAGQIVEVEKRIKRREELIETTEDIARRREHDQRVSELRAEVEALRQKQRERTKEVGKLVADREAVVAWQRDVRSLHEALAKDDVDLRLRLRARLRDLIERVEVFPSGDKRKKGAKGADLVAYIRDAVAKPPSAFVQFAREQAATKVGRFVRVHFKTGRARDLVPPGSIALGWRLLRSAEQEGDDEWVGEWVAASVDLDRLHRRWKRAQREAAGNPH